VEFQQLTVGEAAGLAFGSGAGRGSRWDDPVRVALALGVGEAIWIPYPEKRAAQRGREALLAYLKRHGHVGVLAVRVAVRGSDVGLALSLWETEHGPDQAQQPEVLSEGTRELEESAVRRGRRAHPATSAS